MTFHEMANRPEPPTVADQHNTPAWLPFARLNLVRNPFGSLTQEDRTRAAVVDPEPWLDALCDPRFALQWMGDCGRGKSTHLFALLAGFPQASYTYLPEDGPLPEIPAGCPLFIDEAQRLPWLLRRRVFRRGVPLVLGTHRDLTKSLQRAGYHVETREASANLTRERLSTIFSRRIELARLGPGELPTITMQEVDELVQRCGTNVRMMENILYQQFQDMCQLQS